MFRVQKWDNSLGVRQDYHHESQKLLEAIVTYPSIEELKIILERAGQSPQAEAQKARAPFII